MNEAIKLKSDFRSFIKEIDETGRCVDVADLPRAIIGFNSYYSMRMIFKAVFDTYQKLEKETDPGFMQHHFISEIFSELGWCFPVENLICEEYCVDYFVIDSMDFCATLYDDMKQLKTEDIEKHIIELEKSISGFEGKDLGINLLIKIFSEILISRLMRVLYLRII